MVLAVAVTWLSLLVAFYSVYPVGFYVSTFGFGVYVLAAGGRALATWLGSRPRGRPRSARGPLHGDRSRSRRWAVTGIGPRRHDRATLDPFMGLAHMLDHPFLRSAFVAGTCIALAAGLVGYVVVLRGQVFSGDALSHVAFTGALAALAFGIDLRAGLYGACVVFAVLLAALGRRASADDTVIGSVFAWVLGPGRPLPFDLHHVAERHRGGGLRRRRQRAVRVHPRALLVPGRGRLGGGARGRGGVRGHRAAPDLRQPRRVGGRGPRRAGPGCWATPSSSCWA